MRNQPDRDLASEFFPDPIVIENARILVTGGDSYIASKLAERLDHKNHVVVIDNGCRDSLSASADATHRNMNWVQGGALVLDVVRRAAEGADYIIHLAATAGVDSSGVATTSYGSV